MDSADAGRKFQDAYGILSPEDRASLHKIIPGNEDAGKAGDMETQHLKHQVQGKIEEIEQLLSGALDDSTAQRLTAVLDKLRGALHGGLLSSREALALALQEASTAVVAVSSSDNGQQTASALTAQEFWEQHHQQQEMVGLALDEGVRKGYLDKDTRKELKQAEEALNKEAAAIAQMPEGEEKDKANAALLIHIETYYDNSIEAMQTARANALAAGDTSYVKLMDGLIKQQETANKGLKATIPNRTFLDERSPAAGSVATDWGDEAQPVIDVTHNDIEVPNIAKTPRSDGHRRG